MTDQNEDRVDEVFRAAIGERVQAAREPRPFDVLPTKSEALRTAGASQMNTRRNRRGVLVGAAALVAIVAGGTWFSVGRSDGTTVNDSAILALPAASSGEAGAEGVAGDYDPNLAATPEASLDTDIVESPNDPDAAPTDEPGASAANGPTPGPYPDPAASNESTPDLSTADPSTTRKPSKTSSERTTTSRDSDSVDTSGLVGLSFEDASALVTERGLMIRKVKLDGEVLFVTMDYRTDRINVEVVDGVVTAIANVG